MHPIARRVDTSRQPQGNRPFVNQDRGFRPQTCTGRDYSKLKCFSCGQFGHMQSRCPRPDASLPFKPAGWYLQSESRQQMLHRENSVQTGTSPTPVCTHFIQPPSHLHQSTRHRNLHHLTRWWIRALWRHRMCLFLVFADMGPSGLSGGFCGRPVHG